MTKAAKVELRQNISGRFNDPERTAIDYIELANEDRRYWQQIGRIFGYRLRGFSKRVFADFYRDNSRADFLTVYREDAEKLLQRVPTEFWSRTLEQAEEEWLILKIGDAINVISFELTLPLIRKVRQRYPNATYQGHLFTSINIEPSNRYVCSGHITMLTEDNETLHFPITAIGELSPAPEFKVLVTKDTIKVDV